MIGAALLISAGLLATQITISEVSATREGGRIAITVKGDAMIDPEAASAKLTDGRLYLSVRDARVREANRAWDNDSAEGAEEIRAHRHKQRVELDVPLGDGGCQGPVELEASPGGLRALVACEGEPRPAAARVRETTGTRPAPRTDAAAREVGQIAATSALLSVNDMAALKAKLALDAAPAPAPARAEAKVTPTLKPVKTLPVAAAPAPAAPPVAAAPLAVAAPPVAAAPPVTAAPARSVAGAGVSVPKAPPVADKPRAGFAGGDPRLNLLVAPTAPLASAPAPTGTNAAAAVASSSTSGGAMLGGLALIAIAAAAFFFSRRRRSVGRQIEILETASLGPKRALVVARVGGARMVLGSSEAGITLIQTLPEPGAEKETSRAALLLDSPPVEEAQWDAMVTATLTPPAGMPVAAQAPAATLSPGAAAAAALAALETPAPMLLSALFPADVPAPAPVRAPRAEILVRADDMRIEVEEAPNPRSAISLDSEDLRSVGQAGVLARLFRRGAPANDAAAPRFEDMLEDSFEDQELRRKLALGLPGRVR